MFPSVIADDDNEYLFPITLPCSLKRKRSQSPPPSPIVSAKRMVLEPIEYKPQRNYAKTLMIITLFLAVLSLQVGYEKATKLYGRSEYLIERVKNIPNTFELRF